MTGHGALACSTWRAEDEAEVEEACRDRRARSCLLPPAWSPLHVGATSVLLVTAWLVSVQLLQCAGQSAHTALLLRHLRSGSLLPAGEERLLVLADMSSAVYALAEHADLRASSDRINAAGYSWQKAWPLGDCFEDNTTISGPFIPGVCVATKENPRQAVISIKGTSLEIPADLKADVVKIVGGKEPKAALAKIKSLVRRYQRKGYTVLVTGHSLGGYLAEVASTHLDLAGAGFHAPGPDGGMWDHNGEYANPGFCTLNAWDDPIGNFNFEEWTHKQEPVYYKGDSHFAPEMMHTLQQIDGIRDMTNLNIKKHATRCDRYLLLGPPRLPAPVGGSDSWWLWCSLHGSMHKCGGRCCCNLPYAYDAGADVCK
eukprot:CAMPEP_0197927766 /NCGR_PEP_ID=MMETSP1439-20131203/101231_1 /TAXON_ID=66791 /ORGANISM="Gonyaulax spinifera, Strain CCMP409" /LENGTH=370 /DNA_ID=CAMNT_0043550351 /DNA_START=8 /DNA_END=1120 /DNA_ORIENTATION=-